MEGRLSLSAGSTALFAAQQANQSLGYLSAQIELTIKSPGVKNVHALRVSIRRFGSVLVVLKACFGRKERREVRRGLKRMMERAAAVRDLDIAIESIENAPSASRLLSPRLAMEREQAARALLNVLKRWVAGRAAAKWQRALEIETVDGDFQASPIRAIAARMLPRMLREYVRRGREAARRERTATELHQFRIATKKLRYTLDLFAQLYGSSIDDLVDELKRVQTQLGEINDCAMVRRLLSHHRGKHVRSLAGVLKKKQRSNVERFRRQFSVKLFHPASVRRWMALLGRTDGVKQVALKPLARGAAAGGE